MKRQLQKGLLVALAGAGASCTLTMMYVFLSGNPGGGDMRALLTLQASAIPVALAVLLIDIGMRIRSNGLRVAFTDIWRALPAWLLLALLLLNLLVGIGELALLLRQHLTDQPAGWFEHVPLVSALTCSLAVASLYARLRPASADVQAGVARW